MATRLTILAPTSGGSAGGAFPGQIGINTDKWPVCEPICLISCPLESIDRAELFALETGYLPLGGDPDTILLTGLPTISHRGFLRRDGRFFLDMAGRHTSRWTIGFDAWGGVPVRLHLLTVLFAVVTLSVTFGTDLQTPGLMMLGVLAASVILHEVAHCVAAVRFGGVIDEVVLMPFGGLRSPRVPDEPEPQVFVALIGPMVNLSLVVLATALLVYFRELEIMQLFNPICPSGLLDGSMKRVAVKMVLWINWTLFLLNLIPVFPFDGGPALRAVLWPLMGRRSAALATAQSARIVAAGLLVTAFYLEQSQFVGSFPLWAPLVTLAVFVIFSAQHDLSLAHTMDASQDSWSSLPEPDGHGLESPAWLDEPDKMVLVEHGNPARQLRREAQQMADEAYEDARVDDILARLHDGGLEKLTDEERGVLQRASLRYRDRRRDADDATSTEED